MDGRRIGRRPLLRLGLGAAAGTVVGAVAGPVARAESTGDGAACAPPTPDQEIGPFIPRDDQPGTDGDLAIIRGHAERAAGAPIRADGRVLDERCRPVAGAVARLQIRDPNGRVVAAVREPASR